MDFELQIATIFLSKFVGSYMEHVCLWRSFISSAPPFLVTIIVFISFSL